MVGTSPNLNSVATLSPYIKIKFNHGLSKRNISIAANNTLLYGQKYYVNDKTLIILLNEPLVANRQYSITINNIVDDHGQQIKNDTLSFMPKNLKSGQLSKNAQEELIARNESNKLYDNPILKHLPYFSVNFNLSADFKSNLSNSSKLTLIAQLTIPTAYVGSLRLNYINQEKQQVINYIASLGLNPNNYTINYSIN